MKKVETKLTRRVRRLYEDSAVPVCEIASIAGVTERTIYKYVEKHGWRKRYRVVARGKAAVRGDCAPVTGAGGRFIRRGDKDKPVAMGLKATDPASARRAAAECDAAAQRSAAALAEAEEQRMADERNSMWRFINTQLDKLLRHHAQPENPPIGSTAPDAMRDMYWENLMWACGVLKEMRQEWHARNMRLPINGEVKS